MEMLITSSWKSEKPINQMARAFLTPKGLPSDLDLQLEKKKKTRKLQQFRLKAKKSEG